MIMGAIGKFFSGIGNKIESMMVGAFVGIICYIAVTRYLNKEYPFEEKTQKVAKMAKMTEVVEAVDEKDDVKENMTNIISIVTIIKDTTITAIG